MNAVERKTLILVVDDNEATRYSTSRVLIAGGFQCVQAATGRDALDCSDPFDAVVLDVNLPDVDGFEVCRQLRARAGKADLPIVFLTAERLEVLDTVTGLDAGGNVYLTHPVDSSVLSATVASQIRIRDITARYLQVEQQRHDDIEHTRDVFLGVFGHDLRTPLTVVSMSAEALVLDPRYAGDAANVGRRILRAAKSMSTMLEDLHDYASSKLGFDTQPRRTRVELGLLTAGVIEDLKTAFDTQRLELVSQPGVVGQWDGAWIARIITNLAKNALQYGTPGEPVRITVWGGHDSGHVSVHNYGPVIDPTLMATLFEPMRRATDANADSGHNLGLGLFICQRFAQAHGGRLNVTSSRDEGTCFELDLPLSPQADGHDSSVVS